MYSDSTTLRTEHNLREPWLIADPCLSFAFDNGQFVLVGCFLLPFVGLAGAGEDAATGELCQRESPDRNHGGDATVMRQQGNGEDGDEVGDWTAGFYFPETDKAYEKRYTCNMATPSFQAAFSMPPRGPVYYCEYRAGLNVRKNSPYGRGRHVPLPELHPHKVRSNTPLHEGSLCFLGAVEPVPFDYQCHWDEKVEERVRGDGDGG
ncbi:hypothetical protein EDB86DRAFT_3181274 [Lactarius hatsudake]|nr:hypothetical protein EDB86DRAFT_3181274 [Lactarius hatsudake]